MNIEKNELVSMTTIRRELTDRVDDLQEGRLEKIVITRNGNFEAVLLSVPEYEGLIE